jgi:hypothetical protein
MTAANSLGPGAALRQTAPRRRSGAALVGALLLLNGCIALTPVPEHQPLNPSGGQGIVFGRIVVTAHGATAPPANPGADWSAAGLSPRPELRFYLEHLATRAVALPPVSGNGLFAWALEPGDYLLLTLPEQDVGAAPESQRFRPVAALRVPKGGPWCVGAMDIGAAGPLVMDRGPLRVDATLERAIVVDRCMEISSEIAGRYGPLASPAPVRLMVALDDLLFQDAALFDEARRRLDAAAAAATH